MQNLSEATTSELFEYIDQLRTKLHEYTKLADTLEEVKGGLFDEVKDLEAINTSLLEALRTIGWTLHNVPLDIRSIAHHAIDKANAPRS